MKGDETDQHARAWQPDPARTMRVDVFEIEKAGAGEGVTLKGSLLEAIEFGKMLLAGGMTASGVEYDLTVGHAPADSLYLVANDWKFDRWGSTVLITRRQIEVPERPEGVPYVVTYGYWTARAEAAETALRELYEWVDPNEIHERVAVGTGDPSQPVEICGACGDEWPCAVDKALTALVAIDEISAEVRYLEEPDPEV